MARKSASYDTCNQAAKDAEFIRKMEEHLERDFIADIYKRIDEEDRLEDEVNNGGSVHSEQ